MPVAAIALIIIGGFFAVMNWACLISSLVATTLNLSRSRAPGSGCVDFDVLQEMKTRLIYSIAALTYLLLAPIRAAEPHAGEEALVERSYWAIQRIEDAHKKLRIVLSSTPRPKDFNEQLEGYRKSISEARKQIDELTAKIKVGESIFSYPGLIRLGRIRYVTSADTEKESRGTYYLEILIGYSDTNSGGSESRFYEVHFDRNGSILDHRVMPRMTE